MPTDNRRTRPTLAHARGVTIYKTCDYVTSSFIHYLLSCMHVCMTIISCIQVVLYQYLHEEGFMSGFYACAFVGELLVVTIIMV